MTEVINLKTGYGEYAVEPEFNLYADNNRLAIRFLITAPKSARGEYIDATVNIPDAYIPSNNFVVLKDYGHNQGAADALISAGIIETEPAMHAQSGFITAPIHELTDTGVDMCNAQLRELFGNPE